MAVSSENAAAPEEVLPPRTVGKRIRRKEDRRLVTGSGRHVGDLKVRGLLHAAAVRSPYPHARIVGIDPQAALALRGVAGFYSAADLRGKVGMFPEPAARELNPALPALIGLDLKRCPMEPLPSDRTLWVGQPVGYVVAEDRYLAEDAVELVQVEYEPLPFVSGPEAALEAGAALVHPELASNVQQTYRVETGDPDRVIAEAPRTLRARLSMGRHVANAMEPRGIMAEYDRGRDLLTVWSTNIRPHLLRALIAEMLDMPLDNVRVLGPDIGGSFGSGMFHEEALIPFLARELGRPVRWIEDRRENLQNTRHSRDQIHDVEVAFDDAGTILALRDDFYVDFGAYNHYAITVTYNVASHFRGPLKIDDFSLRCTGVLTNKAPVAPVRGAGRPECVYVVDRILDMVADELEMDPVEVRFRNLIRPEDMPHGMGIPYRDGVEVVYDRCDFPAQLRQTLDAVDRQGWRERRDGARRPGRRVGIGISSFVEGSGVGPHEGAILRIDSSGHISLYTGAQPHGQGLETTLAQVAADQLGVEPDDVTVRRTDTDAIAFGVGTFASRSAVTAGNAVMVASIRLREKVLRVAGLLLEADPADLEMWAGRVSVRGTPERGVSLREVAAAAAPGPRTKVPEGMAPGLEAEYYFVPPTVTWASGTHAALVEVDEETGTVDVLEYVSVDDCGRMLNPLIVEGQIHGGIVHGIGNAMLEEAIYDEEGQLVTATYMDYLLPTSAEVPVIRVEHQEYLSERNPLGAKGVGEGGAVSPPAAVSNAIADAFRPMRLELVRAPVTPEMLLGAIREHAGTEADRVRSGR